MLQDGAQEPVGLLRRPARGWFTGIALFVVVALIGGVFAVFHGASGYYAISPGAAPVVSDGSDCHSAGAGTFRLPGGKPCVRLVLPAGKGRSIAGSIMMVDVLVGPATPSDYLLWKLPFHLLHRLRDGTVLVPASAILGNTPPSQLGCQDNQQMNDATSQAAVVALKRLGYPVQTNQLGAQIDEVSPNTPANSGGVKCNDLVTAIDGQPVHTAADLVDAVHAHHPGDVVHLTATRTTNGKPQTVQLSAKLTGAPAASGQAAKPNQAFLGVVSQTRQTFSYQFPVDIQVGSIGGPSAGLALTLGLIDSLSGGKLTGGHRIAATGTIDLDGNVGDVGGVAQKAVAVRRAGAEAFLVPVQEYKAAKSEAGSMKVYAVSTLAQALDDLKALGGQIPPPATPAIASGAG